MRRAIGIVVAILVVATPWAFAYGPLFPWSAIKPGYEKVALQRADIFYPKRRTLDPAYLKVDDYLAEAETFHKLRAPYRLRVIDTANWDDFHRFSPFTSGRSIGAATFATGMVIFVSPKLDERGFDHGEFLRHEISHAIVNQNVSFLRQLRLRHYTWLFEGVPVWFGRQRAYLTQDEFLARARDVDLAPYFEFDANAAHPPNIDMRFAYVAWRDFLDYLAQQRGKNIFDAFFQSVQQRPEKIQELFRRSYGRSVPEKVGEFQRAIREGTYRPS
jgi:hypothetical protein